ncbi:MAG: T9SS type A sorting domain-containing protein [Bacteroidetes bacterium]|nr:T9SS type A sorting domain-containing protein [Bacteroidota bacterium]
MNYKQATCILVLLFLYSSVNAQRWMSSPYLKAKPDSSGNFNFYDIQKAFLKYEKKYDRKNKIEEDADKDEGSGEDEGKFDGYMQYKRWEWFTEQRVYPTGTFPALEMIQSEYQKFVDKATSLGHSSNYKSSSNTWLNLSSPTMPAGTWAGMGRVNCLAFLPGNNNTLFIGAACGGVWKSTDGGQTWAILNTDQLPSLSITSICIDPSNTSNIYLATGDNFTGIAGSLKPGHYSAGIFKSNDGGQTWVLAGMPSVQSQQFIPQQMIIDQVNPAIMILASNTGIWKTIDSGTNWTLQQPGFFYSMEFNPLNHNVVFATDWQGLWRSNNNGTTWTYRGGGYPNTFGVAGRVTLAVTPADTNIVYTWGKIANATTKFKKYTNAGNTFNGFVNMTDPYSIASPYGFVDMAIGVSKTNALNVIVGGVTSAKSLNGGTSWVQGSDYLNHLLPNYFHGDIKKIIYEPGSGTKLYALNDAGLAVSADNSLTWTNISNGLQITDIYKVASDPSNADIIYYGSQDNGSNRWNNANDSIEFLNGGDGFQPLVDPNHPDTIFTSAQIGNFKKSTDGGVTFFSASPGVTLWNPPFMFNPLNSQTMYAGCSSGLKKSIMGGIQGSYVNMTLNSLTFIKTFDVSKADTNYQYAASTDSMIKTTNNGVTWTLITSGLPVNLAAISYVTCSSSNPNKVWVTFSGYSAGNKVYMSNDGGNTWINYSGTLPNIPINCMVYVEGSNDEIYIGTDFGVFYRDAWSPDWSPFNTGLPNVIVGHLDIHYGSMKIRAGTYGRGIWETNLLLTGTLPVELLSFTGNHNAITNANDLKWTTASEINVSHFDVMKSNDSKYFSSIGQLNGAGNSSQIKNYVFYDRENTLGSNYYYLNQIDFNGQSMPSNIIYIRNGDDANTIALFPNPASDKIQFQFLRNNEIYDLELYDVVGQQIIIQPAVKISADKNNTFDISFLNSGVYF